MATELETKLSEMLDDGLSNGHGSVVSLVIHKTGKKSGRGKAAVVRGDDTVHVVMWSGFDYKDLVDRSVMKLQKLWETKTLLRDLTALAIAGGATNVTLSDVSAAVQELQASLERGPVGSDSQMLHESVWGPLTIGGRLVPGAKVYLGTDNPGVPHGTVYLGGVKLGEKVVTPAVNPALPVKSSNKTIVKDILRSKLPIGLYVRYKLSDTSLSSISVGQDAVGDANGVPIDLSAVRSLFRIAV